MLTDATNHGLTPHFLFFKFLLIWRVGFSEVFQFNHGASLSLMLSILFPISAVLTDVVRDLTAVRLYWFWSCVCVCGGRVLSTGCSAWCLLASLRSLQPPNTVCSVRPAECCRCWCHVVHVIADWNQLGSVCLSSGWEPGKLLFLLTQGRGHEYESEVELWSTEMIEDSIKCPLRWFL